MSDWNSADLKEEIGEIVWVAAERSLREQLEEERATVRALIAEREIRVSQTEERDAEISRLRNELASARVALTHRDENLKEANRTLNLIRGLLE